MTSQSARIYHARMGRREGRTRSRPRRGGRTFGPCHSDRANDGTPPVSSRPSDRRDSPVSSRPSDRRDSPVSSRPSDRRDSPRVIPTERPKGLPPCHPDRATEGTPPVSSRPSDRRDSPRVIPTERPKGLPPCHPDRATEGSERRDLWALWRSPEFPAGLS